MLGGVRYAPAIDAYVPPAPFNPGSNELIEGADSLEDLTEPPKASSTSLRISEGDWFDAAPEDEHYVMEFPFRFCHVRSLSVCHCYPEDNPPWMIGAM